MCEFHIVLPEVLHHQSKIMLPYSESPFQGLYHPSFLRFPPDLCEDVPKL